MVPSRVSMAVVAFALLPLSSCADHTDFSGTYVGEATGTYRPTKDGDSASLTMPNDAVVVRMTSRHYQFSEIEVTVRGCVLRSGEGGGETMWTLWSDRGGGACNVDVPKIGVVAIKASGGLERRPPSRSSRPVEVHLSFHGDGEHGELFSYTIDAKPKKK